MYRLSEQDKKQLESRGVSEIDFIDQLDLIKSGVPFINLQKPCTLGDGIKSLSGNDLEKYNRLFEDSLDKFRPVKFVPSSGAASRMFGLLNKIKLDYPDFKIRVAQNTTDKDDKDFLEFIDRIEEFAFYDDLKNIMSKHGESIKESVADGKFDIIIDYLLTEKGLDYSNCPKGLIKFHRYDGRNRVAFEEHLVEALEYSTGNDKVSAVHFTILEEHEEKIRGYINSVIKLYTEPGFNFDIGYSFQSPQTDIIAVDFNDVPLRDKEGCLVFRPGGHGALLGNLGHLDREIIFIKNIDNVVPDYLKETTYNYKKALAGMLVSIKSECDKYLTMIYNNTIAETDLNRAINFAGDNLDHDIPESIRNSGFENRKKFIFECLNRPLRVCGVVKNEGEPGGGPFWIKDSKGKNSKQIVESAQVDISDPEQKSIWEASTHFNPVDLVCSIHDFRGKKFDLEQYVDYGTVFITKKSKDGIDIKSMELPGLWNGSMAYWNTVFVEVPLLTFNPVKTVMDLLKKEHLPEHW